MPIGTEILAALLTINGLLITILLAQISRLNDNLAKLWKALDEKVDGKVCQNYRDLCFRTCPERNGTTGIKR